VEIYETEEQQAEKLRAWFKKRGKLVVFSLLAVIFIVLGIQYWQHHTQVQKEAASSLYQSMMMAIEKQDETSAKAKAKVLSTEYSASTYGNIAKLYLAKVSVQQHKLEEAKPYLDSVIKHSSEAYFQNIARLRLAKILILQNKTKEAMALLDHKLALLQELKADILVSEHKHKEAQRLYQKAYESISQQDINHPLLKMKLELLGDI